MDKDNLSLTIAIVSLVISVYIFISKHYRELYRLGLREPLKTPVEHLERQIYL